MQYNLYSSEELEAFKAELIEEMSVYCQAGITGLAIYVDKDEMLVNDMMFLSDGESEVIFID